LSCTPFPSLPGLTRQSKYIGVLRRNLDHRVSQLRCGPVMTVEKKGPLRPTMFHVKHAKA
jgi:hypothetical protein